MQQAYYPPPMYPQPYAAPPQMPSSTGEGMKYTSWYIAASLILSLLGTIYMLISVAVPAAQIGAVCLVLVFAVFGFILFLMAAWKLWEGKQEFGPEHDLNVNRCVQIFVIQFIIILVSSIFISAIASVLYMRAGATSRAYLEFMLVVPTALGIVEAYLGGLFIFYPGKYFMKPEEKARSNTARALLIIGSLVTLVVAIIVSRTSFVTSTPIRNVVGYSGAVFSMIAYYFFYQIFTAISERFQRGEILRPALVMMGPQPYMMQPPPYGAPPPGYAPPPYNPYAPPPPGF